MELINRIKATKQGDPKNGLTAWTCASCISSANAPELYSCARNDAIRAPEEPDVIEISDSESPSPQPSAASAKVVSSLPSDDDDDSGIEHHVKVDTSNKGPQPGEAPVAILPALPRKYVAPPWLEGQPSSSDPWEQRRNSKLRSPTSSRRKSKQTHNTIGNTDSFYFSITSWMEERKTEK
jgi:hypothetical protein